MTDYDVRDISIKVGGVEIMDLAPGGESGMTPSDGMGPTLIDTLKGEVGFSEGVSTAVTGTISVMGSSDSIPYLIDLCFNREKVSVEIESVRPAESGFKIVSVREARFGKAPEVKPGKEMGALNFDFEGLGYQYIPE